MAGLEVGATKGFHDAGAFMASGPLVAAAKITECRTRADSSCQNLTVRIYIICFRSCSRWEKYHGR